MALAKEGLQNRVVAANGMVTKAIPAANLSGVIAIVIVLCVCSVCLILLFVRYRRR